jgi:hypothetical protein
MAHGHKEHHGKSTPCPMMEHAQPAMKALERTAGGDPIFAKHQCKCGKCPMMPRMTSMDRTAGSVPVYGHKEGKKCPMMAGGKKCPMKHKR